MTRKHSVMANLSPGEIAHRNVVSLRVMHGPTKQMRKSLRRHVKISVKALMVPKPHLKYESDIPL